MYQNLASEIVFTGTLDPAKYGLVYRKGKSKEDVLKARTKAFNPKNGHAKIEHELSMFELYLKDIFKKGTK